MVCQTEAGAGSAGQHRSSRLPPPGSWDYGLIDFTGLCKITRLFIGLWAHVEVAGVF